MDQDGTWHGGRPRSRRHCVRWGPSSPLPKMGAEPLPNFRPTFVAKRLDASIWHLAWRWALVQATLRYMGTQLPSPIKRQIPNFRPFLLRPNGWMHQDATWYGGRLQPRRLCVRWGPSPYPKRGGAPQLSAHVYCGQTAAWIKMQLGKEVGLGLCDTVLDENTPAPPLKGHSPHNFRPMSVVAKRLDGLRCHLVWRYILAQATLCSIGTQLSPEKRAHTHPPNFWPVSIVAKWLDGSRCHLIWR